MFVEILSLTEKEALMQLLACVAQADGKITEEEERFLAGYADEHCITVDLGKRYEIRETCSKIASPQGKVVALQELIKLALADGHYDTAEQTGVQAIADQLAVSSQKVQEIEEWVIEGQRWIHRGEQMVAQA
jgi:uncharacterized tellurite resistance protein B-like protein